MHPKVSGFTLIEMIITVAIAAILLTLAIPSFTNMLHKNRLKSAAENLYAELQFARAEAIKRNQPIRVSLYASGSTWCYGLKEDANCDCQETDSTQPDFCEIDGVRKVVSSTEFEDITITNVWGDNTFSFSFTPLRGTVNSGSAEFKSSDNKNLKVTVSPLGRVRLCSPSGDGNINDYPAC